ncbi:hypothetical protein SALBM311S_11027 [Streptomyces alboniger]
MIMLYPSIMLGVTVLAFIMLGEAVQRPRPEDALREAYVTVIEEVSVPSPREGDGGPLLEVRDLHVEFRTREGVIKAVNGVNYSVDAGETLAVLGESGSGKSVTAQAVMGILDMPPARIPQGEILFRGQDMLKMSGEDRRKIRGRRIAMIFQDALSSLNPVWLAWLPAG